MRFKDSLEQEVYLREATKAGTMELVYAGLDILGSTPWRVNKNIFDIVLQVWNSGERMGKIPPAEFDKPEPVLEEGQERDIQERTNFLVRHKLWSQRKANNHSDRCSVNYKIEIARAVCTIFFPPAACILTCNIFISSWAMLSICLTVSISVDAPTPSLLI